MTTLSTGDKELDRLITEHGNATFDCGEFREPGEDPGYDEDRQYQKYEEAALVASNAREALIIYLRQRLSDNGEAKP